MQLVDPSLKCVCLVLPNSNLQSYFLFSKPVKVSMETMFDPAVNRNILVRVSKESQVPIPLPPRKDLFKDQAGIIIFFA